MFRGGTQCTSSLVVGVFIGLSHIQGGVFCPFLNIVVLVLIATQCGPGLERAENRLGVSWSGWDGQFGYLLQRSICMDRI